LSYSLEEILSIVRQVCAALEHAHANGIIHRDLKPENVLLAPDGTAKLVDFGLARSVASRLTSEGTIPGRLPEALLGLLRSTPRLPKAPDPRRPYPADRRV